MRVPRIFINLEQPAQDACGLELKPTPSDAHHLSKVLRLGVGAQLVAIDRESRREFGAFITTTDPVTIRIASEQAITTSRARVASVCFALCKGEHTEIVIEKCTELGVETIALWEAERSVVKIAVSDSSKKLARWQRIAETAAKQCRRREIPKLLLARDLTQLLDLLTPIRAPGDLSLCCSLMPMAQPLRDIPKTDGAVHFVIGPEGDLTDQEHSALLNSGFTPVTLGSTILRAETAAIAAVAMANGLWGDR